MRPIEGLLQARSRGDVSAAIAEGVQAFDREGPRLNPKKTHPPPPLAIRPVPKRGAPFRQPQPAAARQVHKRSPRLPRRSPRLPARGARNRGAGEGVPACHRARRAIAASSDCRSNCQNKCHGPLSRATQVTRRSKFSGLWRRKRVCRRSRLQRDRPRTMTWEGMANVRSCDTISVRIYPFNVMAGLVPYHQCTPTVTIFNGRFHGSPEQFCSDSVQTAMTIGFNATQFKTTSTLPPHHRLPGLHLGEGLAPGRLVERREDRVEAGLGGTP